MIRTSKQTTDSTPIDLLQWTVRMTKKLRFGQDWGWRSAVSEADDDQDEQADDGFHTG